MSEQIKYEVWQINRGIEMRHFLILAGLLTYFESSYLLVPQLPHIRTFSNMDTLTNVQEMLRGSF